MRRILFPFLLVLATLPATIFLLPDGYFSSSDGMIHLYRLFELDRALHEGVLFPRWFPLSGYGYGLPVLNYYPPLTYYLGEVFHLAGVGYIAAIKLTIAIGFGVAALAMFFFARELLGDGGAFVAAIAYAYSPYLLSDAYVRGNFPEMLTMSWLPLALWTFRSVMLSPSFTLRVNSAKHLSGSESRDSSTQKPRLSMTVKRVLLAAVVFAAIILTHHLTAMLFAALLLAYLAFLVVNQAIEIAATKAQSRSFGCAQDMPASAVKAVGVGRPGDFFGVVFNCRDRLLACGIALALALLLSAFYWVPALAELNLVYVSSASLARFLVSRLVDPADFFAPSLAYTYLPQSDALKHAFGFPQTLLALLAGVVALAIHFRSRRTPHAARFTFHVLFFFLLVAGSTFMTLTLSAALWYSIPLLRFMQFPWRFQILATLGIAFLLGVWAKWIADALAVSLRAVPSTSLRTSFAKQSPSRDSAIPFGYAQGMASAQRARLAMTLAYSAFAVALIALGVANLPVRAFVLSDAEVNLTRADDRAYVVAQMGWGWTREFVPATAQEFESIYAPIVKPNVPPPDPARPVPSVQLQNDGLYSRALRVSTAQPFELSLKTFFFPGWQAYIDGTLAPTYPRGSLGIATVAVPPGEHAVLFRFEDTPLRMAMNVVSLVTLVGILLACFLARRRAFIALIGIVVLLAALFAWHPRETRAQSPIAIAANLDQRVQLIGYATERADESLDVTLYWFALNEMDRDYNSYAHLIDAAGNVVAQHDGPPDQGLTPTTRWLPGEIVADRHALALRDLAPGEYRLAAGMYLPLGNGFQSLGERVDLNARVIK